MAISRGAGYGAVLVVFCMAMVFTQNAFCQDAASKPAPKAVTTADAEIPFEQLQLLLKPLTKEELVVEADAWRDLLKQKVQEIAKIQIELLKDKQEAEKNKQAAQEAKDPETDNSTANVSKDSEAAAKADLAADNLKYDKKDLVERLPVITEEKARFVKRLDAVLDALEAKGGDAKSYRKYVTALTGIAVESIDAASFFSLLKSWVFAKDGGQRWLWNLGKFLLILVLFYFGASLISGLVSRAASRVRGTSKLLANFLRKFVKQMLMIVGFIVALTALEVNITPLLAAMGAAGFVIGFALQGTLSNFASGLLILAYRPFDVGDAIDAAGVSGTVDSVSLFSTLIRSFDNKLMIVPNNDIWGGTITNSTASDTRRVDMVFGIGYDDDIAKAKEILQSLVSSHELVLQDPAPTIQVNELADSSVNFICRPWTRTENYWSVYWELTESVKLEFDRNKISIPYPQTDVHVHQNQG